VELVRLDPGKETLSIDLAGELLGMLLAVRAAVPRLPRFRPAGTLLDRGHGYSRSLLRGT
jgi:hypothetical protein